MPSQPEDTPTFAEIRSRTFRRFQIRPCLWQMKKTRAALKGDRDVVCIAGTGMGKTITFWMPLLFSAPGSIQIVVTPLNILGKQNVETLEKAGYKGIFICAKTATPENFQAIQDGQYQAVVINPEELMKDGGGFEWLCKLSSFTDRIISIIFDEAHCISTWGAFRAEYKDVGRLRFMLPRRIPIVLVSATLPALVFQDVKEILHLRDDNLEIIRRSNDRPNVHVVVRPILHTLSSFIDLHFLLRDWKPGDPPPPKFLVFFDDINVAIQACRALRALLPREYTEKLKWFNSDMSNIFKTDEAEAIKTGDTWGLFTTDSFGMGMDISDIFIVVQWRATCTLSTLWQRFGRAGRNRELDTTAILFAEKDYFDEERKKKAERKQKRLEKRKRSQADKAGPPAKRARTPTQQTGPSLDNGNVQEDKDTASMGSDSEGDAVNGPNLLDLRLRYTERKQDTTKKGRKAQELEPAMDDFINADVRGLGCRRVPTNAYFENNRAESDHMQCDETLPTGCRRCSLPPSRLCCDVHNKAAFSELTVRVTQAPRLPRRSQLDKNQTMTARDFALCEALNDWREGAVEKEYGAAALVDLGPALIMPTDVLNRIIWCAHASKITTKEDLIRETRWVYAESFGEQVISIIHLVCPPVLPPPLTTSTPLRPLSTIPAPQAAINVLPASSSAGTTLQKERAPIRCSACGTLGHNKSNRTCPKHPSHALPSSSLKENNPHPSIPPP